MEANIELRAAFVVAPVTWSGASPRLRRYAATTRPNAPGRIGLPGGKCAAWESYEETACREAGEEGWHILDGRGRPIEAGRGLRLVHRADVDGYAVAWYSAPGLRAVRLHDWPERGRVQPVAASAAAIARSGMGNAAAMAAYVERAERWRRRSPRP